MTFEEHWFPVEKTPPPTKRQQNFFSKKDEEYDEEYCLTCPAKKYCVLENYVDLCGIVKKTKPCRDTDKGKYLTCIDCKNRIKTIDLLYKGEDGC